MGHVLYRGDVRDGEPPRRNRWAAAPGAELAVALDQVVVADLGDADLLEVIAAHERLAAWSAGAQLTAMAEFAARRPGKSREFASDEIAPVTTLTPRAADTRLDLAEDLAARLPAVLDAMARGELSFAKARLISEQTEVLDDERARAVAAKVLPDAGGWTTGQLRHRLTQLVLLADPVAADRRATRTAQDRDVWLRAGEDGNAELGATVDAYDGAAAYAVIEQAARAATTPGDTRTLGQRRAAAFIDLILGRNPASRTTAASRPSGTSPHGGSGGSSSPVATSIAAPGTIVNVVVPLSTLASLLPEARQPARALSQPGWIEGLGPVPAQTLRTLIRELLTSGSRGSPRIGWRIVACDDQTGAPHALGRTRYRPPQALQELIQLRDRTCRFPGCRREAVRCDIDYVRPWDQDGDTCDCNLHSLCRHHHRLKQRPGWTVHLHDGISTWTTPTGHTYQSKPPDDWSPATDHDFWQTQETTHLLSDPAPPPAREQDPVQESNVPGDTAEPGER